jgi:hypothetical protein
MERRLAVLGLFVATGIVASCEAFETDVATPDASALDADRSDAHELPMDAADSTDRTDLDATATNYLAGAAFETNCQGWSGSYESLSTSNVGRSDDRSCQICRSGSGGAATEIQRVVNGVPLETGETLEFGLFAKAAPDASILKGNYIQLSLLDADGGVAKKLQNAFQVGATDWVETTVSVKAPRPTIRAFLEIRLDDGDAGRCTLVDDAWLIKK